MVATKLLATLNQTPTPGKRRSSSFDHTSSSTPSIRSASFDCTVPAKQPGDQSAGKNKPSGSASKAESDTSSAQGKADAPNAKPTTVGDTSQSLDSASNQNNAGDDSSYWDTAKSYASQAYDKIAPSSSSSANPPPALAPVSEEHEQEGGHTDYIGSVQQGVSNLLSSLYIRSYTNLNDLVSGEGGAISDDQQGELIMPEVPSPVNNNSNGNAVRRGPPIELGWLMRNPYNVVSGRHNVAHSHAPSSMNAVRSLLTLVPVQPEVDELDVSSGSTTNKRVRFHRPHSPDSSIHQPKLDTRAESTGTEESEEISKEPHTLPLSESMTSTGSIDRPRLGGGSNSQVSDEETASRLAEGTIRALRDLALEEAVELHEALRFWTERWERPVLSWLEAGPTVWLSKDGYNHQVVGRKVSQIQAVLARRCTSVGELQEHVLRAGWQRGVEKWGVLGQGGEWAAVAGGDGGMEESTRSLHERGDSSLSRESSAGAPQGRSMRDYYSLGLSSSIDNEKSMRILGPQSRRRSTYYGQAEVMVKNTRGGRIERDDPALAAWTVDALRVIRDQLYKAGNTSLQLPYYENWKDEVDHFARKSSNNLALKLFKDGYIKEALQWAAEQLGNFYNEHLSGPIKSIYGEIVKGKPDVADKKARLEEITTLKNMIGSWLDETFPEMSEDEKIHIADAMDISLVEQAKEECIKRSVFEINNIVRLSMIEMQHIKKELMSALVAMDELMSSNEINAKIAAMTPAFILLYGTRSIFRFCFYALLKFGKSKEETFQTFRHTILDIERLLTMRDNPPDAPPPLSGYMPSVSPRKSANRRQPLAENRGGDVLDANDLGMLMLHIHECRKLLWEDRRRFSASELRNVTEDLAELAGERGPVSVQQQLAIISRMCRTYSFLKVISTGHSFDFAFRSSL